MALLIKYLSNMICFMNYFDDLRFISADVLKRYKRHLDICYSDMFTVEFMLTGSMYHGVDGAPPERLTRPAVFWHHPTHRYQYGPLTAGGGWHHHWVSFRGSRGRRLLEEGFMKLAPRGFVYAAQPLAISKIFEQLKQKAAKPMPQAHAEGVLLLERLLCLLLEQARFGEEPWREKITALSTVIQQNAFGRYDFEMEARKAGLSYSHFRRLFRQCIGRSPHDYLLHCRMQAAAEALKEFHRPIKEIAFEAGYDDPAQLSKLFRQKIGLSPKQFRETLPAGQQPDYSSSTSTL